METSFLLRNSSSSSFFKTQNKLSLPGQNVLGCKRRTRTLRVFASDSESEGGNKASKPKDEKPPEGFKLDDINPYVMGRRSRALINDVWQQFTKLSSPTQSIDLDADFAGMGDVSGSVFETPQASYTTVLVAGATGKVGRILLRKLLLRGYKVRTLVRNRESRPTLDSIPQSVVIVSGDVGDYEACRRAVEGADKIICCTGARTTLTADLSRVEDQGVANLARAYMDHQNALARRNGMVSAKAKKYVGEFPKDVENGKWKLECVGIPEGSASRRAFDRGQDRASVTVNDNGDLVFEGSVYSRGGVADCGSALELPKGDTLEGCEGMILRICGDGNQYTMLLTTDKGLQYSSRFTTRGGFQTVRLPFNIFRPVNSDRDLDPLQICRVSIRFEPRLSRAATVVVKGTEKQSESSKNKFRLVVVFVKAVPGGEEPDFILVSCAGISRDADKTREKVISYKRKGEARLRNSGLGYTIIRPGQLVEEPGGYKALVFDQGNRISQGISYADVADVCLKALHDPLARNKAFEVCSEYTPEQGLEMYELIAHLPDKANNYLSPALATLEKNT